MNTRFFAPLMADAKWEFRFYYPYIEFDGGNESGALILVLSTIAIGVGVFVLFHLLKRSGD